MTFSVHFRFGNICTSNFCPHFGSLEAACVKRSWLIPFMAPYLKLKPCDLCPRVKHIRLGTQTGVNDNTIERLLRAGVLLELEEFHCEHTTQLTAESVQWVMFGFLVDSVVH